MDYVQTYDKSDEADNDDEQLDTTDMPNLESGEFAKQRKNKNCKG